MSASITVDVHDFAAVEALLARLPTIPTHDVMEAIGAIGESQTRRRITDEKSGPDGEAWPPNRAGTSILLETGQNLLASIAFISGDDTAEWGAAWEFAHVHQNGAVITPKSAKALAIPVPGGMVLAKRAVIPARPFVGISDENEREIEDLVTTWLGRRIAQ